MKKRTMNKLAISDWNTYSPEKMSLRPPNREVRKMVTKFKTSDGTYKGSVSDTLSDYGPYLIEISICVVSFT